MKKILIVAGTRPEIIKLAPVAHALGKVAALCLVHTGQHREMGAAAWQWFDLQPHYDLDVMEEDQPLSVLLGRLLQALHPVIAAEKPDFVIVQGDTAGTLAGALAAFYQHIPVAHVEAGLRTFDPSQPFPEEMQRVVISRLASLHFAPTAQARDFLLAEGIPEEQVILAGNTVVDSLKWLLESGKGRLPEPAQEALAQGRRLVAVTAHRRENQGERLSALCESLKSLAARQDAEIIFAVHPSPGVRHTVFAHLENQPGIRLLEPIPYPDFIHLLHACHFIITDSGGIQEEASMLHKPVILLREVTERPEAEQAGVVKRVSPQTLLEEANRLLDDAGYYASRCQSPALYGDGNAALRISLAVAGNRQSAVGSRLL